MKSASVTRQATRPRLNTTGRPEYGDLFISDLKRMKDPEAGNARLKKLYADLSLVHDALKDAVKKL